MSSFRTPLLAFAFLVSVSLASAAPVVPPDQKQIEEWVRELGSRRFADREKAQQKLWQAGRAAEPSLKEALKSEDQEVRRRAEEVLVKFKWGVYPDTPKKVVELISEYQNADKTGRLAVVGRLFEEGNHGCVALLKIVAAEEDGQVRRDLNVFITREAGRVIPSVVAEKNYATLESLLDMTLSSDRDTALPGYVAYYLLRGKLDERIDHFTKLVKGDGERKKEHEVLFYLHRAKGDVPAALAAAEKANRHDLVCGLLEELGRWKELVEKNLTTGDRQEIERLGFRAAYQRLAGDGKGLDETLGSIKKFVEGPGSPDAWHAAKALFLNDRPDDALAMLTSSWNSPMQAEVLSTLMRYPEALKAADKVLEANPEEGGVAVVRARILHFLGEKEKAKKAFEALAEKIKPGNDFAWFEKLIETEYRLGMREQAIEHCARALNLNHNRFTQVRLLRAVMNGQEETAQPWWNVLRRRQASEEPKVSMASLRSLLAGKIKGKELTGLIEEAERLAEEKWTDESPRYLQAAGDVARTVGDDEAAARCYTKAAEMMKSPEPLIRWGDALAGRKQWEKAAEAYAAGWDRDRRQPLALFLRGRALFEAGQKKDGESLMEQSHWLPLGDDFLRVNFARELSKRGFPADAKRERELLLKTAAPASFQVGEALRFAAIDALKEKNYLESADLHQKAVLRCFKTHVSFIENPAYVGVPLLMHRLKARGLVAAGKIDEAKKEIEHCLKVMPGDIDLAIAVVPELENRGEKKLADEVFTRVMETKAKLCKDYPQSAGLQNSVAWLCACCKRDLAAGQRHAEEAVKLEPDMPGYRDTLAEVLFQRGEKDKAVSQMKKCLELEPRRVYYQKQLKRFEAGDPKAELPDEGQ